MTLQAPPALSSTEPAGATMGKTSKKSAAMAVPTATRAAPTEAAAKQDLKLDPRGDGMYSGTFRWLKSKRFPTLPPFPSADAAGNNADREGGQVCFSAGWEGFLRSRSSKSVDLVEIAKRDPSCLDAMSFPVTFLHVVNLLKLMKTDEEKHVVVLGATRKAEQRVWSATDYWFDVAHFFQNYQITLWFVGPEVDANCSRVPASPLPGNLRVKHIQGTFKDFVKGTDASNCSPTNTILIGYNTGFGNFVDSGRHDLLFSWLPDLYTIADEGFPAIFTCANDYADMNGEFAVQSRIVGAKMLLLPQQNPFSMATHFHEEGKKDTAWSRGNSFLYAIQGCDTKRRTQLKTGDVVSLQNRLDASLDLHLQDALGRHFYKGMVLTKEQASRCKALTGTTASVSVSGRPRSSSGSLSSLKTPTYQIVQGSKANDILIVVHVPDADGSQKIAVDVSDSSLTLLIPTKYALRATLPFEVENNAPVHAHLSPPFLQIACTRK